MIAGLKGDNSQIRELLEKCLAMEPGDRPSVEEILELPLFHVFDFFTTTCKS